ncbi:MAG: ABC transporter permease [Acidobacteria bacterium]|nr:ABC transporter permease [Acidobacteriota bacterium]
MLLLEVQARDGRGFAPFMTVNPANVRRRVPPALYHPLMLFTWRFTLRSLRHSPAFTAIAILTLAIGIGANTTIFSLVNAILLRPIPGFQTNRIVQLVNTSHQGLGFVNQDAFREIQRLARSYQQLAAMQFCQMNLTSSGEARQLTGPCLTANWFHLQNEKPLLGRTFAPEEDQPGRSHVVVLDHGFWLRHFAADPNILGRTMILDKAPWQIIGVMPPGFQVYGVTTPDIYTPYVMQEHPGTGVYVAGRLKPGITLKQATMEAGHLSTTIARINPDWKHIQLKPVPVLERITGDDRGLLFTLLGAVSLVLLIACANVANLMLARSTARTHEMAIRAALGATRGDILQIALRESLVISTAAAACSVAIAHASLDALRPLLANLPRAAEISIDTTVLCAALALGICTAILSGLLPAWRMARSSGVASMRGRSTARWQHTVLTAEIALAFVLLTGAGLLLRSFVAARSVDLGYQPANVLTHFLSLTPAEDGARTQGTALYARIRDTVAAIPGVTSVATATSLPPGGVLITMDVQPEGQAERKQDRQASLAVVSPSYFRTLAIQIRAGRVFLPTDRAGGIPVAVVSQSVANRHYAGNAIGRRIMLPEIGFNLTGDRMVPVEIIGIAGNVCVNSVKDCEAEHIYLPESQSSIRMTYLAVRTTADPLTLARAIRRAVHKETPLTPLDEPRTMEDRTAYLTDAPRRGMWLLGLFAAVALVLSALGVYGVTAYLVSQRTKEIGIRMALGADFLEICQWILRGPAIACLTGLLSGTALAALLMRFIQAYLYGVPPTDPQTLLIATSLLLIATLAATLRPVFQAAVTNPVDALRGDPRLS